MRALVIPDLHLGKGTSIGKDPIGIGLNSRVEDQQRLLDHITQTALDKKVDTIFLLGDIWDDVNPKSAFVKVFFTWISKLTNSKINVYIIMGNHDFVRTGRDRVSMLDSLNALGLDRVWVFSDIASICISEVRFVFLPFCDRKQLEAESLDEAITIVSQKIQDAVSQKQQKHKKAVLLGHMTIAGSLWVGDEIDQSSNEIFLPIDTFKDFDYVWMGHIHKHQVMKNSGPHIAHVGSLDKTSFGEKEKYIVFFDSEALGCAYLQLPCRELVDVDLNITPDAKDSTACVLASLNSLSTKYKFKDAIVRMKIKLNSHDTENADKEQIVEKLKELEIFHLSSYNETRDVDRVIIKNAELDETIDHHKAAQLFVSTIKAEDSFKQVLLDTCKSIIKEYKTNLES